MLVTEQERLRQEIAAYFERQGSRRENLIPALQQIQAKFGWISDVAMQLVADHLSIHPAEVHGVVSFYSFLRSRPQGRFVVRLCRTLSCVMQGKDRVARQLEADLGIGFGETTADGRFTLAEANCLGMCDQGPALLVNDHVYTRVTPAAVHDIIEECKRTFGVHAMAESAEAR
ncbi:MAG: NADH-quinone oxidoreductase subunit NuoE [Myxococcales bacterium]|nr:NADH-quinone oxidoreductase subunit NuoE [Myxococcales bacterium]